ncbi:DUF1642 domain-containing protein [Lacticaseibacillus paracasei]|uniref:Uncharacterized protein n=1 Tax=Lacticaseibacillus paracasei TaxID=1597 RepID=A0A8B3GQH3_LACPA|nr:DUF1642 domain-containing protein [Lacticaseibacillus paracasei]RNE30828.1 hypothetical protein FAM6012_01446 [Lacticaseibacillus paracasei]
MSEEKLYAVKNDEGKYLLMDSTPCWDDKAGTAIKRSARALGWAKIYGGHVVTLVEEPEKVVLTKEQAEIVDDAHEDIWPATYISGLADSSEQRLLIEAFVNGYTVAKEKKYNVKVPHTKDVWYYKESEAYLLTICPADDKKLRGKFTEAEIEHYGLQDCEKEEVTDDGIR